jgi:hypothetical protein
VTGDSHRRTTDPPASDPLHAGDLIAAQLMQANSAEELIDSIADLSLMELRNLALIVFVTYHRQACSEESFQSWAMSD